MDDLNVPDTLTDAQKAHYLLLWIPLITLIFYKANIWMVIIFTIVVAIMSVYIHILISFKNQATKSVVYTKKNKLSDFWYIPYLWLFVILSLISVSVFIYSFILTIKGIKVGSPYNYILFFGHIFVLTFDIFILIVIRYYRRLGKIKNGKAKNKI